MPSSFVGDVPFAWLNFDLVPGEVSVMSGEAWYGDIGPKAGKVKAALADPGSPPLYCGRVTRFETMWLYKGRVLTLPFVLTIEYPDEKEYSAAANALIRAHVDPHVDDLKKAVELAKAQVAAPPPEVASRERIADDVKVFVWQRDQGQCVSCGSNMNLEFDHIIPVTIGGGNTARNVQLLCEPCNRTKGANLTVK